MSPFWGVSISVDDADATVRKAQQLGGTVVVPPTDFPAVGRLAVLKTPRER